MESNEDRQRQLLWEKLMEEHRAEKAGSIEELVDRYGEGKFDFDTLVSLIRNRCHEVQARKLQERGRMTFEEREFEKWHDNASTPDDLGVVLFVAVRQGILTKEEQRMIESAL